MLNLKNGLEPIGTELYFCLKIGISLYGKFK